jgi:hypothetical protein
MPMKMKIVVICVMNSDIFVMERTGTPSRMLYFRRTCAGTAFQNLFFTAWVLQG